MTRPLVNRDILPTLRIFTFIACLLCLTSIHDSKMATADLGVTDPSQFSVPKGFAVELVYEVPSQQQGSWVSLTVDPKGRLIASDQDGSLYRVDVSDDSAKVEKLAIEAGMAQGLLCAFDSLYINVNGRGKKNGVYRLTDTNGDDQYDKKEYILPLDGGGEHGPHALILTPDGKRILTCAGNMTKLPKNIARSRVPQVWDEDHLLGRMPDARGHAADRMAPGGWIGSFNPDGSDFELIATGFRNEYDIALNRQGDLFSYDADMEWDVGTPWYRPTRINHVISGAEFGWRNGTGKWPAYYPDSFGAAVDIGPGSPTGICFGYGTKFPAKFQNALFISDWSYGNIHVVQLTPDGSSYTGSYETFATAAPLPVTDLVVRKQDGALYFAIGGRKTQSGLYRIVYRGDAITEDASSNDGDLSPEVAQRRKLESYHHQNIGSDAIDEAMSGLASKDRGVRFAARIALEHQPVKEWASKIKSIKPASARIHAVIALARVANGNQERFQKLATNQLKKAKWENLAAQGQIDLLRAYALIAIRLGEFSDRQKAEIRKQIDGQFPTGDNHVDRELAQMMVYLDAPETTEKIVSELKQSPSQENQIFYALTLRGVTKGWTDMAYKDYFGWFNDVQSARGGMSFGGFINNIKNAALENVPSEAKKMLADVLKGPKQSEVREEKRELVQNWKVEDLLDSVNNSDRTPDFANGKTVFASAQCYKCHRIGIQGGALGPDLTGAGGRFSPKDLLTAIIDPNQTISDQYAATQFLTEDGKVIVGRVVNMSGNKLRVMTNMLDPSSLTEVVRDTVEETRPSKNSLMPAGLLDTFTKAEIVDLVAYLRSGGNENHLIYKKTVATK